MIRVARFFRSSIGHKILMALTGIALLGFLVGHMLGNLLIYQGRDVINAYASWLKSSPLLWVARIGLLGIFALHIGVAIALHRKNRRARPSRYAHPLSVPGTSATSRFVMLTGLTILAFVIFHLLHLTLGVVKPEAFHAVDSSGRHDVYSMVVTGFRDPWVAGSYVFAMVLLGLHLWHGVSSVTQTLGISGSGFGVSCRVLGRLFVVAIVAGNISIPVTIYTGIVGNSPT